MKLSFGRIAAILLAYTVSTPLWCQTVDIQQDTWLELEENVSVEESVGSLPPLMSGLWENSHRVMSFEGLGSAHLVLKLFYGWYYDRAAEPGAITEEVLQPEDLPPRPRNDATSPEAQHLLVEFQPLIPETETSGAWNIWITYPDVKRQEAIPVAVFDGKLYVDFFLGIDDAPTRFFQAASNTNGITISTPLLDREVCSYLVTSSRMYKIRYWQTDMEYDGETKAVLTGEDSSHEVPKHLLIGDTVYTCVAGRRVDIRNVEEIPLDLSGFTFSGDNRIVVQNPAYLTKMAEPTAQLYQLIAEANSRRVPPPPIPLGDLDFHYKEINDLRKYMIPQPEFLEFEAWEFIKTAPHQSQTF